MECLLSALEQDANPDKPKYFDYNFDYLIYSVSNSINEQEQLWDTEYVEIIKYLMFKKFDNFVEYEMDNFYKERAKK